MPFILWIKDHNGKPCILRIGDKVSASRSRGKRRHTYKEFEQIVGRVQAALALGHYFLRRSRKDNSA